MQTITISGSENVNIAEAKAGTQSYTAEVLDSNGTVISGAAVTADVLPRDGVTVTTEKNTVNVIFDESAAAQSYVLYITYGEKTASKRIFLKRYILLPPECHL